MLELIVRETAPAVAKVVTDFVVKAVTNYPIQTAAVVSTCFACYQTGRADAYNEVLNSKKISV